MLSYAAAAVLLVVISSAYWFGRGPGETADLSFLSGGEVEWLREVDRRQTDGLLVREDAGSVEVGIYFPAFFDEEAYTVQFQTAIGEVILEKSVAPTDLSERSGLRVRIRTEDLPPGEYCLVLLSRSLIQDGSSSQTRFPFILTRERSL